MSAGPVTSACHDRQHAIVGRESGRSQQAAGRRHRQVGSNHAANDTHGVPKMGDASQNCDASVNKANISGFGCAAQIKGEVYCEWVARTDENGRQLKALLDYLLDGEVEAKDIYDALGISSSTYYRRIKEDGLSKRRRAAASGRQVRSQLSRPADSVRFDEPAKRCGATSNRRRSRCTPSANDRDQTQQTTRPPKLSELRPRSRRAAALARTIC